MNTECLNNKDAVINFLTEENIEGFCWNKLFSRKLYSITKVKYDENRLSFCDIYTNLMQIYYSNKVSYVGDALYDYYQMDTTLTHKTNIDVLWNYYDVLREVKNWAIENGFTNEAEIYTVVRANKCLFNTLKKKKTIESNKYRQFYYINYNEFLCKKKCIKIIIKYSLDNPIKCLVKYFIVKLEFWHLMLMKWLRQT